MVLRFNTVIAYQLRRSSTYLFDTAKGLLVSGVLGLLVIEIIYFLLRLSPDWWWLWTAIVLLFFTVVLANLAPMLILPLFFKLTPLEDRNWYSA